MRSGSERNIERKTKMSAQTLVTALNALYLIPMGLVSLVGTAALLKLVFTMFRSESHHQYDLFGNVEDA
jgi:hypothetical protein